MHINAQVVIQHSRGPSGFIYNDLQWFYIFITFFEVLGVGGWWVDECWWFMGATRGHLFYAPSWASASWASWVRAASMLASPGSWEKEVFFSKCPKSCLKLSCLKILKLSHFKLHLDVPWMSLIPRHTSSYLVTWCSVPAPLASVSESAQQVLVLGRQWHLHPFQDQAISSI